MQDDVVYARAVTIAKSVTVPTVTIGSGITMQDNIVTTANLSVGAMYGGVDNAGATTAALAVTDASTIAIDSNVRITRVKPGASATSVVVATGTLDGQELTILNVGSVIVSLAATNLSAGAQTVATSNAVGLVYDLGLTKWFHRL
jgi:hypothetical protein